MKLSQIKNSLKNPAAGNRTAAFWSWNGDLRQEEMQRQLGDFADKGIGGFFMHAREGLEVPYLSEGWMDRIQRCAREGRKLGLLPYIYDEDKWPSGMAGGKVAAMDPHLRATAIVLTGAEPGCYCYGAHVEGKALYSLHYGTLAENEQPLYIDVQKTGVSDWYSGSAPADNLNMKSVRTFLDITHEKYQELFDGKLSENIEGFFTDEPNFADFFANFAPGCPWLPWTEDFDDFFRRQRGYSIIPYLPYLFFQGEHAAKTRHDYWRTLTELFSQTYFKQIYDWCEDNGVKNIGHLLFENSLCSQARVCGAAMPHYQYLHVPGIDILGERTEEYLTVKQCTSVANQMGRPAVSETYGCTGWQLSFEGQKWLWDWQAVQGISLRCPHLAQYSIKGLRKRDYPPFFNYQAPWWLHDQVMEDYCARLSVCAESGTVQRPVLVIHPQSSLWLRCGSDPDEDLGNWDQNMGWTDTHIMDLNAEYDRLSRLAQALLKNQCDFDFGDEMLLAEHGSIDGGKLRISKALYDVVVVPELDTIFDSTLKLLQQFEKAGGTVLWLKKRPDMIEGEKSVSVSEAFPNATVCKDEIRLLQALEPYRQVKISDIFTHRAAPLLTSLRKVEDGYLLMVVNNDRERGYRCRVELPGTGAVEAYDLLVGTTEPVLTDSEMGFYQDFAPADCRVYFLDTQQKPRVAPLQPVYHDVHESPKVLACLGPVVDFERTSPNALPIDRCRWRTNNGWSEETTVWQAQRDIRDQAGFQPIHANGMPMRYGWIYEQKQAVPVQLKFRFVVEHLPVTPICVALEERQAITVSCNGAICENDAGWFVDRSLTLVQLENVHPGENELLLDVAYTHDLELEDIYICGDFAVDSYRRLTKEPKQLRFGDWGLQGYPFYAGSMRYNFTFHSEEEQGRLRLGEHSASLVIAKVNGGDPIYIPWRAANEPIIGLTQGENTLELEVVGSNRNLLGPRHQPYQLCSRIDWRDFRTEEVMTSPAPVLIPYGLFGQCYILKD